MTSDLPSPIAATAATRQKQNLIGFFKLYSFFWENHPDYRLELYHGTAVNVVQWTKSSATRRSLMV